MTLLNSFDIAQVNADVAVLAEIESMGKVRRSSQVGTVSKNNNFPQEIYRFT